MVFEFSRWAGDRIAMRVVDRVAQLLGQVPGILGREQVLVFFCLVVPF
jgi:hypothetical protein